MALRIGTVCIRCYLPLCARKSLPLEPWMVILMTILSGIFLLMGPLVFDLHMILYCRILLKGPRALILMLCGNCTLPLV